jgi:hypothetical protein
MLRFAIPCLVVTVLSGAPASGQVGPYNPYAMAEDAPPPLAADGTIQWGVFYKSAKLQRAYERLWSLGACRGSNRAITVPVAENKLVIDRLPEAEFRGVVQGATGDLAGGMVAFTLDSTSPDGTEALVAQLHPAGVSRLAVRGRRLQSARWLDLSSVTPSRPERSAARPISFSPRSCAASIVSKISRG